MAVTATGYSIIHTAAADASTGRYFVKELIWHGYSNAAHTISVKDGAGTVVLPAIIAGETDAVLGPLFFKIDRVLDGIETDVLGSGTAVYILG